MYLRLLIGFIYDSAMPTKEKNKVNKAVLYMPRWHSWRRLSIVGQHATNGLKLAAQYSADISKHRVINDRMNQLIFERAMACDAGQCTVAEFHTFARMVCDGMHPDYLLVSTTPSASMAPVRDVLRKIERGTHAIDVIDVDALMADEEEL